MAIPYKSFPSLLMKLSVNVDNKQKMAQNTMMHAVRHLLESWQVPLLENEGVSA